MSVMTQAEKFLRNLRRMYVSFTRLQRTNWLLLGGCVLAFFYAATGLLGYRGRPVEESAARDVGGEAGQPMTALIPLADLTRRNLFQPLIAPPPLPKIAPPTLAAPPPPPIPISQKASHLRLVGIINGDPLQAVIEDQKRQRTVYVTSGQRMDDIQVEKVLKDRVILKSDEERMDLPL